MAASRLGVTRRGPFPRVPVIGETGWSSLARGDGPAQACGQGAPPPPLPSCPPSIPRPPGRPPQRPPPGPAPRVSDSKPVASNTQTHAHGVGDAVQPSHPLSPPSPALSPSQALQIAEKRELKGKGEMERYTQLNAVPKNTKEG